MRTRDKFWYATGLVIGRVLVAGRAITGQARPPAKVPAARGERIWPDQRRTRCP